MQVEKLFFDDGVYIPKAEDMYEITVKSDKEEKINNKYLKRIVRKIKRRANKGYYSAKISWALYNNIVVSELTNKGYMIKKSSDNGYWMVSWW